MNQFHPWIIVIYIDLAFVLMLFESILSFRVDRTVYYKIMFFLTYFKSVPEFLHLISIRSLDFYTKK
jgi:hypothetical protein